jgi:hypothetical protein
MKGYKMHYRIFFTISKGGGFLFDAFHNKSIPDDIDFDNIEQAAKYLNDNSNKITITHRWYTILPAIHFE